MTQAATYTMDSFIGDVREVFASTNDPLAQAQAVAGHLKVNPPERTIRVVFFVNEESPF